MPVIKSAIKKLRRDRKREVENNIFRKNLDTAIRVAKKQKNTTLISKATSIVDRAVKKNIMQKNKAGRIKSSLSKLIKPQSKIKSAKSAPAKKRVTKTK